MAICKACHGKDERCMGMRCLRMRTTMGGDAESMMDGSPVAAGKAAVQLVKVQPCQLLGSGT